MAYSNVSFENFYEGGASSLSPDYGNYTGYRIKNAGQLGFPGSPQTANQLGEAINALKQGVKAFEVTMLTPDTEETIPKQHFKEMRAIMKLSGVKPSVHGPMIDAAGFSDKGNWDGDQMRRNNEDRMFETMKRAYDIGPEGNIPVVFHSSAGVPGNEWEPGDTEKGEDRYILKRGAAINQETGQAAPTSREYKFRPDAPQFLEKGETEHAEAGVLFAAEDSVKSFNRTEWDKKLTEVAEMNKHAGEIMGSAPTVLSDYRDAYVTEDRKRIIAPNPDGSGVIELPGIPEDSTKMPALQQMNKASIFLENAELAFNSAFHHAYKYGTPEQQKELKTLAEEYSKNLMSTKDKIFNPENRHTLLDASIARLNKITDRENGGPPELFKDATEFALDKATQTFGNLAMRSYDNLGKDKSPMLAIEPFHFGAGISKSEEMVKLIEGARKNFTDQLVKKKGMSEKEAKKVAEQKIGATWDVGHINMMKKYGFKDEDVIQQTQVIQPLVKHIHITDNFGYADTHLAPGMGNVPMKAILEELEKNGRYDEMRKIVESGAFVQHFKKSPHPLSLAAFGSPIYSMKAGPQWNQVMDVSGSYFGGYGTINPQQHHSMYGAGFTTMPVELGGEIPGGNSRFGGTPMA
jgi:sugar phosphate isomerase/epimerase